MNRKGQMGISVIIGIMIFLSGIIVINILKPDVTLVRNAVTGLNCANASAISDGTKLTCLAVDLTIPYFILIIISAAGGIIISKVVGRKR